MQRAPAFLVVFLSLLYLGAAGLANRAVSAQDRDAGSAARSGPHIAVLLPLKSAALEPPRGRRASRRARSPACPRWGRTARGHPRHQRRSIRHRPGLRAGGAATGRAGHRAAHSQRRLGPCGKQPRDRPHPGAERSGDGCGAACESPRVRPAGRRTKQSRSRSLPPSRDGAERWSITSDSALSKRLTQSFVDEWAAPRQPGRGTSSSTPPTPPA